MVDEDTEIERAGELAYVPTAAESRAALLYSAAAIGTALLTAGPAIFEVYATSQSGRGIEASPWAWLLLGLAAIELAYAAYVALAPDFSALWAAACFYVGIAALAAAFLGFFLWAPLTHPGLATLELAEHDLRLKARLWCLALIVAFGGMAYLLGRTSVEWRRRLKLDPSN
ncbi:MAG TPA: hypothetical protein VGN57_07465 [Pirellulaceae bacterium]|jgi:hypothetical protein|nr:hypothetical protein [Pirellulaceae bacterium]